MNDSILFCNGFSFNVLRFDRYRHNDCRMGVGQYFWGYMEKGEGRIVSDRETVILPTGSLFFIPKGYRYQSYWSGTPEVEFISLGFSCLPNFEDREYPPQALPHDEEAVRLAKEIASAPLDAVNVGRFYTLTGRLMKHLTFRDKTRSAALVEKVHRLLLEDPERRTGELARACAVSESALYAAFKRHGEGSINDLRHGIVMERARALLISTDISVEEISRRLSFSSDAYFRKCFKAHFGVSPRQMRKSFGV